MSASGNTSTGEAPAQGNSSSRRPTAEETQAARLEARVLTETEPSPLTKEHIGGLDQNDLLGAWASLDRAIDAKGSKATEKELGVLILLNDVLNVVDAVDYNSGSDYGKIGDEQIARQCCIDMLRTHDGENSDDE